MSGAAYVSSHVEVIAISVPIQLYCSAVHQLAVTNVMSNTVYTNQFFIETKLSK